MPLVPHLNLFIDECYAGRALPGVTVPDVPRAIRERLEHLAANPHAFNQVHGCCGFAAVIMALIRHDQNKFQALCAACYNNETPTIPPRPPHDPLLAWPGRLGEVQTRVAARGRPLSLHTRLAWREDADVRVFYNDPADPVWEVRVSVGLIILFKEWLRGQPAPTNTIWTECTQFSTLFGDYRQNSRIHGVKDRNIARGEFSRKRGDLALTPPAVRQLAQFVFEHIFYTGDLATAPPPNPSRTAFTPTLGSTFLVGGAGITTFADAGNYLEAQARQPIVATSFDAFATAIGIPAPIPGAAPPIPPRYVEAANRYRTATNGRPTAYNRLVLTNFDAFLTAATVDGANSLQGRAVERLQTLQHERATTLGPRFLGIILGLADLSEILFSGLGVGMPRPVRPTGPTTYFNDMRAYGMIEHWVFVPPEQNYAADGLVVWSWGRRLRLPPPMAVAPPALDIFPSNYLPVWAMPIERPPPPP